MRFASCVLSWVAASLAHGQTAQPGRRPDLGIILCWNDESEVRFTRDKLVLEAVGRAIALGGNVRTIGVRSESCAAHMPDAACFGVPGGAMCQAAVIEREIRAASWAVEKYRSQDKPPYENFRRANPEAVGYGFQYADGARPDTEADRVRETLTWNGTTADPLITALVDFNLAGLLGHEVAHTSDSLPCPVSEKSFVESSGLWQKIIRDELGGGHLRRPQRRSR
jgi:hypothetical protein